MPKKRTSAVTAFRNQATWFLRSLNSDKRAFPNFIIIGAAKGGTTSLFNYLIQHPQVLEPLKKEVHYFDRNFYRGINWYKMHFPTLKQMQSTDLQNKNITGEASPYYLSHPKAAERINELLPEVKLIVMLRNPIDRALSNYQHMVRLGIETESLEDALSLEKQRTSGELERLSQEQYYYSFNHHHYSYTARGFYDEELQSWLRVFNRDKFYIVNSERFYNQPEAVFGEVLQFLGLNHWTPPEFKKFNSGGDYEQIPEQLRNDLRKLFEPHNQRLYSLIGENYNWS